MSWKGFWSGSTSRRGLHPSSVLRLLVVVMMVLCAFSTEARQRRPRQAKNESVRPTNVVLIVADDLGWGELDCYGGELAVTPFLNKLAEQGVRFTDAYATAPVCSPSRAGLMTGVYQQRFGHEFNPANPQFTPHFGLPTSQRTIGDVMRKAGYATGLVGKWHLGLSQEFWPHTRGFDEFFGFRGGRNPYVWTEDNALSWAIIRNEEWVPEQEYLTEAFTREAVDFIDRHKDQPFFLCVAYNAVHTPLQASPRYWERFPDIADPRRRTYAALMSALDDGVGEIMRKLHLADLSRDTLVLFISDNGGEVEGSLNGPLRGFKGELHEGGIRVPFIARWPGVLPAGASFPDPVSALDILPTILGATGVRKDEDHELDGMDLMPYLTRPDLAPPVRDFFWRQGDELAMRRGPHKLVVLGDAPPRLYDLEEDIAESRDVSDERQRTFRAMMRALNRWEKGLAEPLWEDANEGKELARGRRRRFVDEND